MPLNHKKEGKETEYIENTTLPKFRTSLDSTVQSDKRKFSIAKSKKKLKRAG